MKEQSAYDKSKDQEFATETAYENQHMELIVSIHRYDGGQAKIQLQRRSKHRQSSYDKHPKLGRLTYEEFAAVARTVKRFSDQQLFQ